MMVKKIGKFLIILFFFNINGSCGANPIETDSIKIELKLIDNNGNELQKAGLGVPFNLELTISSDNTNIDQPKIVNLEKFSAKPYGSSTTINSINGKMTVKKIYQYEIVINQEGSFILGPIELNGKAYEKYITLAVQKEPIAKASTKSNENETFIKISSDKSEVFLNEPIQLKVKFYYGNNILPVSLELPQLKDFYLSKQQEKVASGIEKINDKNFGFQEWKFRLFPKKAENLVIPAFKVHFDVPIKMANIFSFFGPQMRRSNVLSNALNIKVKALPDYNGKINGIGLFKNFKASVNQAQAGQGEGIVYKIEIEGNTDIENLKFNELNVPQDIKYYDSKNYAGAIDSNGFVKKTFEFIIQSNQDGKHIIPEQTFTFFDLHKKSYQTLKTAPINLEIRANLFDKNKIDQNDQEIENDDEIKTNYENFDTTKNQFFIPWPLFLLLVFLPLLWLLTLFIKKYFTSSLKYQKFKLIDNTQKELTKYKNKNDCSHLYSLFVKFLSQKFNLNKSEFSNEVIKNKFLELNIPENIRNQWENFFLNIIEASFYKYDNLQCAKLLDESENWLKFFKKLS